MSSIDGAGRFAVNAGVDALVLHCSFEESFATENTAD